MTTDSDFQQFVLSVQQRIEDKLNEWLPSPSTCPGQLHEAMRYAMLGGGKRIRPMLVYATGQALGVPVEDLDAPACAIELIHGYSLIHDDLPCMDDDDLRRGQPTCHVKFDQPTAILAGDALQSLAFYALTHGVTDETLLARRCRMLESLALASGSRGMAGGQAIDLQSIGQELSVTELENMHIHKTGAIIRCSILMAAQASDSATGSEIAKLDHFAKCLGLAFQVQDDILDIEGDTQTLGKTQGKDNAQAKPTYPSLMGLAGAKEKLQDLRTDSLQGIDFLKDNSKILQQLATYIISRNS